MKTFIMAGLMALCAVPALAGQPAVNVPYHGDREPKVTYSYKLGLMKEKTRTYEVVVYSNGPKTVPVINGYVPNVSEVTATNGDKHVTYDYRKKVPYTQVKQNAGRMVEDK